MLGLGVHGDDGLHEKVVGDAEQAGLGVEDGADVLDGGDAATHVAEADVLPDLVVVSQVSTGAQGASGIAAAKSER